MKIIRFLMVLVVVLLSGGQPFFAQSDSTAKKDIKQLVKQQIESGCYTIDVNRMSPMSGRSRMLTSPYSLTLKENKVISYLPYMGQAYSVPYGGGNGLNFEAIYTDYSLTFDKKGTAKIKFKSRTDEDKYEFNIQIFNNGSSTIHVTPINRQSITFYGELKEKEIKND